MEKERYYKKKILQDCIMPEGLFEIKDRAYKKWCLIIEDKTTADKITNLLNQQDARIKELEEENQQLKEKLKGEIAEKEFWHSAYKGKQLDYDIVYAELRKTFDETEKLKQTQNQKAIELLEKVKNYFVVEDIDGYGIVTGDWTIIHDSCSVAEYIDYQIEDLKGGK